MSFQKNIWKSMLVIALASTVANSAAAQTTNASFNTSVSKAQQTLIQAAGEGKYTFVLFYQENDNATQAMVATLNAELADKTQFAVVSYAKAGDPTEQALIAKYGLSRAPMPITLAVAPNGAVTGVFAQRLNAQAINEAFVTPTMMFTMKSVQDGKIVLVSVEGAVASPPSPAIAALQADPHFRDRMAVTSMRASDPREAKFVGQMKIDAAANGGQTVVIAPPGVFVGKFDARVTKDEIAAALAKAGKCCNDPHCKHNR